MTSKITLTIVLYPPSLQKIPTTILPEQSQIDGDNLQIKKNVVDDEDFFSDNIFIFI